MSPENVTIVPLEVLTPTIDGNGLIGYWDSARAAEMLSYTGIAVHDVMRGGVVIFSNRVRLGNDLMFFSEKEGSIFSLILVRE